MTAGAAALLATLGVGTTAVGAHEGRTITVEPGHSIQAAIDSADPGDTIALEAGTYYQSLQITTNDLTLRGAEDGGTVLKPPATAPSNECTSANSGATSGVCVFGQVDINGNVLANVHDDTITDLTIRGFPANGVFGYGTDGLQVTDVSAFNDGGYGIARFASTNSTIRHDVAAGNHEAGLYIGDSPDADTLVTANHSYDNGFGIFVRHSHEVQVSQNEVWGNCLGMFVLDDGHPGGAGNVQITDNSVHGNNAVCPAAEGAPPLSGGGIVLVGATSTLVADNEVDRNNHGGTPASGGIVLVSAAHLSGGSDVINDTIRDNTAHHNAPADIVWDGSGHGNTFTDNECSSSIPKHLCE
jgi:nitrous oxidase accessory protein NosD